MQNKKKEKKNHQKTKLRLINKEKKNHQKADLSLINMCTTLGSCSVVFITFALYNYFPSENTHKSLLVHTK